MPEDTAGIVGRFGPGRDRVLSLVVVASAKAVELAEELADAVAVAAELADAVADVGRPEAVTGELEKLAPEIPERFEDEEGIGITMLFPCLFFMLEDG